MSNNNHTTTVGNSIGRVRFINPDTGELGGSLPGGSAIVVWAPDWLDR